MENPFPQIIKTRIAGRKVTKFIRNGFIMMRVVREEYPSVIWVSWIRRIGERRACVEQAALGAEKEERRLFEGTAAQGEKFMRDQS